MRLSRVAATALAIIAVVTPARGVAQTTPPLAVFSLIGAESAGRSESWQIGLLQILDRRLDDELANDPVLRFVREREAKQRVEHGSAVMTAADSAGVTVKVSIRYEPGGPVFDWSILDNCRPQIPVAHGTMPLTESQDGRGSRGDASSLASLLIGELQTIAGDPGRRCHS